MNSPPSSPFGIPERGEGGGGVPWGVGVHEGHSEKKPLKCNSRKYSSYRCCGSTVAELTWKSVVVFTLFPMTLHLKINNCAFHFSEIYLTIFFFL